MGSLRTTMKLKVVLYVCLLATAFSQLTDEEKAQKKAEKKAEKQKMKDRKDKVAAGELPPPSWQEIVVTMFMYFQDIIEESAAGGNPLGDMTLAMGMSMAQIGSNYF